MNRAIRTSRLTGPGAAHRARTPSRRERGFVFVLVLVLAGAGAIIVAAALQRSAMQARVVEHQIEGYERHHELLGARDIVELWLLRNEAQNLRSKADTNEPVHNLALENGVVYKIYVYDGQGTALKSLEFVSGPEVRKWVVEMVKRLPPHRTDLTRRVGPHQISIRAAAPEILAALAGGDSGLFKALVEAQEEKVKDLTELGRVLDKNGIDSPVAQALARNLTFDPVLWRLEVEAVHPHRTRWYIMLAEKSGTNTKMHEWRALDDFVPPEESGQQQQGP